MEFHNEEQNGKAHPDGCFSRHCGAQRSLSKRYLVDCVGALVRNLLTYKNQ